MEKITTQQELMDYIQEYCDVIPVREQVNNKWGNYFLIDLSVKDAVKHIMRFLKEGKIPYRTKRNKEVSSH